MIAKGTVDGDQSASLDKALRQKQAIEGIARRRQRIDIRDRMARADWQKLNAETLDVKRQISPRDAKVEFAETVLDRDFPETRDADRYPMGWITEERGHTRIQIHAAMRRERQEDMRVDKKLHASGRIRKSSGSGVSKSSAT